MSTVKSPKPSQQAAPLLESPPVAEGAPTVRTGAAPKATYAGDRMALTLWVVCILMLACLLLIDLIRTLFRL